MGQLENYHLQENALDKLFVTLCPKNTDISDVLLKVSSLNDFYSTNIYSFASKYCSHHNPKHFPIYDSYVDKVLCYFRNLKKFPAFKFKNSDLKDYAKFKEILIAFRSIYGLDKFNLKEIDKYLWQFGKRHFPKKYKRE